MIPVRLHRFYGDFNCPFCFAQNERLIAGGGIHLVEWRGVVHMTWLAQPMQLDPHESRPNTLFATLSVAEAYARDPREGRHLKDAIYRAFWRDRPDISSPKVLSELCDELRIEPPANPEAHVETQRRWQSEWEDGPYNRRLPALHSRYGALSLGLATPEQLSEFVWTGVDQRNEGDSC